MFLFLLAVENVTQYCIRYGNGAQTKTCPSNTTEISSIDEFYDLNEDIKDLYVISDKDNILAIDSQKLNNSAVDFSGPEDSYIQFVLKDQSECSLDNVGFKSIHVNIDSTESIHFKNFYLDEATLKFTKDAVNLKASKVVTDLRSISFFSTINVTDFHLSSADNLPDSNTTINVLSRLVIQSQKSDSHIDISMNTLTMKYESTYILFELGESAACQIEHNTNGKVMDITVNNVEREGDSDPVFKIIATNGAKLVLGYSRYFENTSPQVVVFLSGGAVMTSGSYNSAAQITAQGPCTIDVSQSRDQCSFNSLSIEEGADIFIENSNKIGGIYFPSYIIFNHNGNIRAAEPVTLYTPDLSFKDTVNVDNFMSNVKIADVITLGAQNATSVVPSVTIKDTASYTYKYDTQMQGTLTINEFNFKGNVNVYYGNENIPTNEQSQRFVDAPQYIFCSKNIDCDSWNMVTASKTGIAGLTNKSSVLKKVCKKVDQLFCAGFQYEDTPINVYPTLCYGEFCSIGAYIKLTDETVTKIGTVVKESAKRIDIQASDIPVSTYIGFDGLKKPVPVMIDGQNMVNNVNIKVNPGEKMVSTLILSNGVFNFVQNTEVALPYILFDQGSKLANETLQKVSFAKCDRIGIDIDALDQFDLSLFPDASVSINEEITLTYTKSGWIFETTRYPNPIQVNNDKFTQFLFLTDGGTLKLKKNSSDVVPTRLRTKSDDITIPIEIVGETKEGECFLEFLDSTSVQLTTQSQFVPFSVAGGNTTLQITKESAPVQYKFGPQTFTLNGTFSIVLPNDASRASLGPITAKARVSIEAPRCDVNNVTLEEGSYLTFADVVFKEDISIPPSAALAAKDCTFENSLTIHSVVQKKSGVLGIISSTGSVPKDITIDWSVESIPDSGITSSSYVVIAEDAEALEPYEKIVHLKETQKKVGKREVLASLSFDHTGISVQYSAPSKKSNTLMVSLIVAASVALVAFLIGITIYCCSRRKTKENVKLLSAETLLSLQTTV